MSALLLTLIKPLWPYLLAGGMALAAIATAYFKGKASEKAKQAAEETKARDISDQVDNDIGALPADAARKELGTWEPK